MERHNKLPFCALDHDKFFDFLSLYLDNSYFIYGNNVYSQTTSLAMGSPLSAIISQIVLDDLFSTIKEKFNLEIKFTCKFVDDSLFIIKDYIFNDILQDLNTYDLRNYYSLLKNLTVISIF